MKFEAFTKVIELLKGYQEKEGIIYKQGLDLYSFNEQLHETISILFGSIYGKDGLDTLEWWCYDNEWGTKGLTMTDQEGNLLCQTIEELHQYLEKNKKEDFELKIPLSQEEFERRLEVMAKGFNKL